ncbi:MAG: putative zinc-binding metallopeptidase [Pirellulaceae bacterium]|nr:putative zinc-binding metallopeptidase [Pirellulaceae bacterium]
MISSRKLERMTDAELFQVRMCDLKLTLRGSMVQQCLKQLYQELGQRGLRFRPHVWLSDEWFSPDGVPGIAIPFYLAHPRLMRLERKQMLEVEGGNSEWCMKILRHEAGHAIDTAYRLRRRKSYRQVFGRVSTPYPTYYRPKPYSRDYVLHLDMWYAQSHPTEDFAESFAVWLRPRSRWNTQYKNWPALKKLEYVNQIMAELDGRKPLVNSKVHIDPLSTITTTLGDHYHHKRQYYGVDHPNFYDRDLLRIFSDKNEYASKSSASQFLRLIRTELRGCVSKWTGESQYTIDQVLTEMIDRCRDLRLRLTGSEADAKRDMMLLLTVQTMNYLHQGYHRVAL